MSGSKPPFSNRGVQCEICGRANHTTMTCYSRYDYAAQGYQTAQALVGASHGSSQIAPFDPAWYPDSGVTNHITADLGYLSLHSEYQGIDQVSVENGSGLHIANIGACA